MNNYQLHFFGDSFTAGDELLDYQHYDNYPAPCTYENLKKQDYYTHNPRIWEKLTKQEYNEHITKQKQKSYASILGGTNHGTSGTSLQSIARDIIFYLENTNNESIIFLQPTGMERWCEYINGEWKDFVANATYEGEENKYFKFKVTNNTDYSSLVIWYNTFITLISYIKNHKNTMNWYLINNGTFNSLTLLIKNFVDKKNQIIKENNFDNTVLNTFNKLKNKIINFPQIDNTEAPYFCPGGHVNQQAHNQLAKKITKLIQ